MFPEIIWRQALTAENIKPTTVKYKADYGTAPKKVKPTTVKYKADYGTRDRKNVPDYGIKNLTQATSTKSISDYGSTGG